MRVEFPCDNNVSNAVKLTHNPVSTPILEGVLLIKNVFCFFFLLVCFCFFKMQYHCYYGTKRFLASDEIPWDNLLGNCLTQILFQISFDSECFKGAGEVLSGLIRNYHKLSVDNKIWSLIQSDTWNELLS